MTTPSQTGPATTDPSALIAYNQWDQARSTFLYELRRGAADIAPRLDEIVYVHRIGPDQDLASNLGATWDWGQYLESLYQQLEVDWTALAAEAANFTPVEVQQGSDQRLEYQNGYLSLQLVLTGLNLFFWNVSNERDQLRQASAQAVHQAERTGGDGPLSIPLPNVWLAPTPLQTADQLTLGTVIVTHVGQAQHTSVLDTDVTAVRQLARDAG
jgi:hypothetical protein